jgi:proteic killer suppression protein
MKVRFRDSSLSRLEVEADEGGYPPGVAKAFRKRMQIIRAAPDERVLRGWKSLHFEKIGDQHSVRLNDQWRLMLDFEGDATNKVVVVLGIKDYH